MEKRPERPQMPTGEELVRGIKQKFIRDVLPVLEENERWRAKSRRTDFTTCPPGGCPDPGDWPVPKYNLDESD